MTIGEEMEMRPNRRSNIDVIMAKKGDNEAFGRLIHTYKHSMYRMAKSILKNEHDVEDAIAESILHAFEKICSLRNNDGFKPWLMKILINECYALLRKRKREMVSNEITAVQHAYEMEQYDELIYAIDLLELKQRIVIILFYYEDMDIKDIAKTLNIPIGTVKSRLYRAKGKLRVLLGNDLIIWGGKNDG